jgi:hypothetical protein
MTPVFSRRLGQNTWRAKAHCAGHETIWFRFSRVSGRLLEAYAYMNVATQQHPFLIARRII